MENYIVSKAQLKAIAEITRYKAMLDDQMLVKEIPAYIAGIAGGGTSYVICGMFGFNTNIAVYNKNIGTENESIEQTVGTFAFPVDIVNQDDIFIALYGFQIGIVNENILIGNFEIINMEE